ncbi:MAG: AAA family ATPase, partial [Deltaproteobacteria bacterium]|nr:AAA family ATPase [Deltaproteobacteria bacterium]
MNALQELPSKGQTFSSIRRQNLLYVDKTRPIHEIISTGGCCFLSRPRRFGKSLLLGTMAEIFRGRRELFQGLWIGSPECGYDFTEYPVVHMSLAGTPDTTEGLIYSLVYRIVAAAGENDLNLGEIATTKRLNFEAMSPGDMLDLLVRSLREKTGQKAVVLIDEYDAPILGVIGDVGQAMRNRDVLRGFYSALKTLSDLGHVHFMFVTGLTKFAKASVFSVFNNLKDLTLDPQYADICGFTVPEFDARLAAYLPEALENSRSIGDVPRQTSLGEFRETVLGFYDGYSWDGRTRVLNPFSLINFLDQKELVSFWYNSGTPTFLVDLICENLL